MHTILQIENNNIPIYYVEGNPRDPIVLVFSTMYGLTEGVENLCEEISYFGASVVGVNLFWQKGGEGLLQKDIIAALQRKNSIPQMKIISHALAYAQAIREENRALIALGIGFGGHLAFCCLAEQMVDAAVMWHPSGLGDYAFLLEDIGAKSFFMHVGDSDPLFQPHEVQKFRRHLKTYDQMNHIQMYTNIGWGFSLQGHTTYNEEITRQALQQLEHLIQSLRY